MPIMYSRLAVITAAMACMTAQASHALSLKEALTHAYGANPTILEKREDLNATAELQFQALSGALPTLQLGAKRGHIKVKAPGAATLEGYQAERSASVSQPIFRGGQTVSAIQSARHTVKAKLSELRATEQKLFVDTVSAYVGLLDANETCGLHEANVATMTKYHASAEDKFALGEATRTEVAQAQARLSQAKSELLRKEAELSAAIANFVAVVGLDPDSLDHVPPPAQLPLTLAEAQQLAETDNPMITRYDMEAKAEHYNANQLKGRLLPEVNFVGSTTYYDKNPSTSYPKDRRDSTALFQISVPLYHGGSEYSQIRQRQYMAKQKERTIEVVRNSVRANTEGDWYSLVAAREAIDLNADAVKAAELALQGVQEEMKYGARTLSDVLDADRELFDTRLRHSRAKFEYVLSGYKLLSDTGQLTSQRLELPVTYFDGDREANMVWFKIIGF
jgi:outer membrane protein